MVTPFDPGLQNERTALAWTRTGLALLVAVLLASRITVGELGVVTVIFTIFTLPLAVNVLVSAGRRYRISRRALESATLLPDARSSNVGLRRARHDSPHRNGHAD